MPYRPGKLPSLTNPDAIALAQYFEDELLTLSRGLIENVTEVALSPIFAAPKKPREGVVVYADGTLWNPGSGEGLYVYSSGGTWIWLEDNPVIPIVPSLPLSVANGGTGDTGTAWATYTPTLTANSGTFTSASAAGLFKTIGKTVFVHITITITTVGTGTFPIITLPVAPLSAGRVVFYGAEVSVNGKMVVGRTSGSGSTIIVSNVDNTNPALSGTKFEITAVYEAA